jgi:hypothetical protein
MMRFARIAPMSQSFGATVPAIKDGAVAAYFIFDVADTIDLEAIAKMQSVLTERAPLRFRPEAAPSYIKFEVPPLSISLPDVILEGKKANARVKVFDYGVVSLRLEIPFSGRWEEFFELSAKIRPSPELLVNARKIFDDAKVPIKDAFRKPHNVELIEDYFTYTVHEFDRKVSGKELITNYAKEVAGLMRGERRVLSREEIEEATRVNISYYDDDVSVIDWDVAFIYDEREAADTIQQILEFANTQLVELRTYDVTLNAELDWIYATDPVENMRGGVFSHRIANQRAQRLRLMLVDIRELMDRTNNALKIIGDAFYARVYRHIRNRLGLADWERQIDGKLQSVTTVYRFLTDQAENARGEVLEWIVIVLIAAEIIVGLIRH